MPIMVASSYYLSKPDYKNTFETLERHFNKLQNTAEITKTLNKAHIEWFAKWLLMNRKTKENALAFDSELFHCFIAFCQTIAEGKDETGRIISLKCELNRRWKPRFPLHSEDRFDTFYFGLEDTEMWKIFHSFGYKDFLGRSVVDLSRQKVFVNLVKLIRPFLIESKFIKKRNYKLQRIKRSRSKKSKLVSHIIPINSSKSSDPNFKVESESRGVSTSVNPEGVLHKMNQGSTNPCLSPPLSSVNVVSFAEVFHVSSNIVSLTENMNIFYSESEKEVNKVKLPERVKKKRLQYSRLSFIFDVHIFLRLHFCIVFH